METKKPVYVHGYVRNAKPKNVTHKHDVVIAVVILAATIGMLAIVFWKVSLLMLALAGAGWIAKTKIEKHKSEPQLIVNYYWRNRFVERFALLRGFAARLG